MGAERIQPTPGVIGAINIRHLHRKGDARQRGGDVVFSRAPLMHFLCSGFLTFNFKSVYSAAVLRAETPSPTRPPRGGGAGRLREGNKNFSVATAKGPKVT